MIDLEDYLCEDCELCGHCKAIALNHLGEIMAEELHKEAKHYDRIRKPITAMKFRQAAEFVKESF